VAKTGLGSSAALITSLVTALLVQAGLIASDELASVSSRRLAHNVAQFVHCLAQGKVGSGFDVSAAAFGSQFYTRFSPAVLQPLMDDLARVPPSLDPPPCCPDPVVACLSFRLFFFCSPARNRSCQC
jgi:phosphomevalonate kinase